MKQGSVRPFGFSLINIRLVFLTVASVHLLVTALGTLSIDTRVDKDPRIKAYFYVRWKLLTCWFNMILLAYLPVRLYCDWKIKKGDGDLIFVTKLHYATDVVMTGILFPVTVFADVTFWILFNTDPSVMAPPRLFNYLPYWAQHSLHSVSFVEVILDLLLTPRSRPPSLLPRFGLLMTFSFIYTAVLYRSCLQGEFVYAVFENMVISQYAAVAVAAFTFVTVIYFMQWAAIDFLWGKTREHSKIL